MHTIRTISIFLVLLTIASLLNNGSQSGIKQPDSQSKPRYADKDTGAVKVLKILDGDSLLVRDTKQKSILRLIGIDAPEIGFSEKAYADLKKTKLSFKTISKLGRKSKKHLEELLRDDKRIKIKTDRELTDHYGRLLVYAFLENGTFINLKMIEDGYARAYPKIPNIRYSSAFNQAHLKAKRKKVGLWSENAVIF